jgi:glycosyltransferase involved in cell wall biosynthesis
MDIAFWAASDDGSSWYRTSQPSQAMAWRGHRVWASMVLPDSRRKSADVVVGSRVARPGSLSVWRELDRAGKRLVLDLDDNYFAIEPTNRAAYECWKPNGEAVRNLRLAMKIAETVTVTTSYLADVVRAETGHGDVQVVPNGLHASLIGNVRSYDQRFPVVGWAGTGDTVRSLDLVAKPLSRISRYRSKEGSQASINLVGTTLGGAERLGVDVTRARAREWAYGPMEYLSAVSTFDVWVAPYRDTEYNRSKFPTKALEAAFLGVPLVASNIQPYQEWVYRHSGYGDPLSRALQCGVWLVDEPYEWSRALKKLVDRPDLRRIIGTAGRSVASRYTLQGLGETWENALR